MFIVADLVSLSHGPVTMTFAVDWMLNKLTNTRARTHTYTRTHTHSIQLIGNTDLN